MSSLQRHIAAVTNTTANLIAQLRELDLLREQVRKAEEFYAEQSQVLIDENDTTPFVQGLRDVRSLTADRTK